ncbi:uncharacterized protein EKO05_0008469 [Ascochyta rabiei]|uniref:uncharacterized protein n=1 Tax=Didymella rabiei TaxID=5454 RepID=UPI00220E7BBD|nr:uncharacterized protein EKO05_0008469 [Ascochyta rabiei]UPX18159.1 hypothetical protein EKO05_0008469 [Ascochyta rabiei]
MASAARLQRLRKLTEADVDALPELAPDPTFDHSDVSRRVEREPLIDGQPAADPIQPLPTPITVQPNTDRRYVWLKDANTSYNPVSMLKSPVNTAAPKPSAALPATDLNRGDLASSQLHFTPIQALAKYPYRFCNRAYSQDIASAFFDQGKFWAREWDLYYLWDIDNLSRPLVLIRETQFQDLLNEINDHLKLSLRITDQQREDALVSRFPHHPRCTPRYLGRSTSREEYDMMVDSAPNHSFRAAGEPGSLPPDERTLEAFKQLMEESFEAQKAKNKASKAKKQQERLIKQKTMADQFKRAQRYLGLRPSPAKDNAAPNGPPSAVDPTSPVPFDFDQSVVFVCVDVESYERAHDKITEVGIATLDTRELARVSPGHDGENWRALVRARHFRVKEHAHLVNSQFVSGHPDGFDFGQSTMVSLADAPTHVAACFSPPFGAHQGNSSEGIVDLMQGMDLNEKRNIIFLGHDTLGDVRYLQTLGYDPMKVDNLLEALDTAVMYRVWRREQNPASLGRILYDFDIAGYKLHNAGNDAVFTMQAMLGMCVREAAIRGSSEFDNMRDNEKSVRLAEALEEAQKKARDEAEGWSDQELDGDGGAPVPISISPTLLASAQAADSNSRGAYRGRGRGRSGARGTSQNVYNSWDGNGIKSGRARGLPDRSQYGGIRSRTRGGHDGRSDRQARGDDSYRGRARGRGSSTASDNNTSDPQQVNYRW